MLELRDYEDALACQSACNLSGVVHSFSKVVSKIWDESNAANEGTDWVNTHPICRLYAEQIAHLSGAGSPTNADTYFEASKAVRAKIESLKAEQIA